MMMKNIRELVKSLICRLVYNISIVFQLLRNYMLIDNVCAVVFTTFEAYIVGNAIGNSDGYLISCI
jgi:hypothetical protein